MSFADRRHHSPQQPVVLVVGPPPGAVVEWAIAAAGWKTVRTDPDDALQVAAALRPDVVLVSDPTAALVSELVGPLGAESVPVVIVAPTVGSAAAGGWLDLGAREVLTTAQTSDEVEARFNAVLRGQVELNELLRRNRELDALAGVDVLTDLPNRRRLDEQLRTMEAAATRRSDPLGILVIDLDRFKAVNDTFGLDGGDEVLRQVAARLRRVVRTEDILGRNVDRTVGRWGSDEFIVAVIGTAGSALRTIAERVAAAIRADAIVIDDGRTVQITVSVGGAAARNEPWPELLRRADEALSTVKNRGGNSIAT